jgi:hypothetical protein
VEKEFNPKSVIATIHFSSLMEPLVPSLKLTQSHVQAAFNVSDFPFDEYCKYFLLTNSVPMK